MNDHRYQREKAKADALADLRQELTRVHEDRALALMRIRRDFQSGEIDADQRAAQMKTLNDQFETRKAQLEAEIEKVQS